MPLLHGQAPDGWRQEVVSTYNGNQFGLYTQRMLRDRRFKYVWNATDLDELYDLQEDPWELRNLVGDRCYDSLIQNMRVRLLAQLQSNGDAMVANSWIASQLAGYS
jgi:arylsulfatase A-like enzyme